MDTMERVSVSEVLHGRKASRIPIQTRTSAIVGTEINFVVLKYNRVPHNDRPHIPVWSHQIIMKIKIPVT